MRFVTFKFAAMAAVALLVTAAARSQPASIEIAFVANAEAGTIALLDVATRSVLGAIDVNPAHEKSAGPGAPNYAQDTDV